MIRRFLRIAVRTAILLVVLAGGAVGFVAWRLWQGPVRLDFLVPRVQAAFAEDAEGWQVELGGLELVWDARDRQTELRALGLRLGREGDETGLTLDAVHVWLRRSALLRGKIVVRAIEIERPRIQLVRNEAGHLAAQAQTETGAPRDLTWLWAWLQRLEHVAVRDGEITFVDEPSHTSWVVPRVDGDAWRWGGPLRVQLGLTLGSGEGAIPIWLAGLYRIEAGTIELTATSPGAETEEAFAAWPATLAPEAHAWVTRQIKDGRVHDLAFTFTAHVSAEDRTLAVDGLEAAVGFTDLTVRYLDTMPAATGVSGQAKFTGTGMTATVERGKLEGLELGPATVRVAWPPGEPNRLAVDASLRGPLAALISVLDNEPVALGQQLRLPTRDVDGTATARVRLGFPLAGHPKLGRLGLHGTATIEDASLPYVGADWDVREGSATVRVDDSALEIDGAGRLRGIPATFRYAEHFGHPRSRRLELAGRLDEDGWRALEVDPGRALTGPIDVTVRIAPEDAGRTVADLEADLLGASLDLPAVAIVKPPGEPGRFVARLGLVRDAIGRVERFELAVGPARITGSAARPPSGGPWSRIDASAFFTLPEILDDTGEPAMQLAMSLVDDGWRATLTSRDAGRLLRAYGYEKARGGRLTLEGTAELARGFPFKGNLTVDGTRFSGVPWLVKLVSLASLRGLLELGSEQTVEIDRLVAAVTHRPPVIEVSDLTARGPKLTLKLAGTVDHAADTIDLQGTLIPSYYLLNEGAGRIPLIGDVLSMATGGAVQAVNFTVRGSRDEPVVTVQPISSLAPGVLRDWLRKLGL